MALLARRESLESGQQGDFSGFLIRIALEKWRVFCAANPATQDCKHLRSVNCLACTSRTAMPFSRSCHGPLSQRVRKKYDIFCKNIALPVIGYKKLANYGVLGSSRVHSGCYYMLCQWPSGFPS
jgi:hypothetical protein